MLDGYKIYPERYHKYEVTANETTFSDSTIVTKTVSYNWDQLKDTYGEDYFELICVASNKYHGSVEIKYIVPDINYAPY